MNVRSGPLYVYRMESVSTWMGIIPVTAIKGGREITVLQVIFFVHFSLRHTVWDTCRYLCE